MKHDIDLHGQQYSVFDTDESQTAKYLVDDFNNKNPFLTISSPKVVLDIGANIGMWSFWVAKAFPESRIYAVEPHIINQVNFQLGVVSNGFQNIALIPCAVAEKSKVFRLWQDPTNSGATGFYNQRFHATQPSLVGAVSLNGLFESLNEPRVDLMKVDIEGMEFELFKDFEHCDKVGSLYIEVHPYPFYETQEAAEWHVSDFKEMIRSSMLGKPYEIVHSDIAQVYKDVADAIEREKQNAV